MLPENAELSDGCQQRVEKEGSPNKSTERQMEFWLLEEEQSAIA